MAQLSKINDKTEMYNDTTAIDLQSLKTSIMYYADATHEAVHIDLDGFVCAV